MKAIAKTFKSLRKINQMVVISFITLLVMMTLIVTLAGCGGDTGDNNTNLTPPAEEQDNTLKRGSHYSVVGYNQNTKEYKESDYVFFNAYRKNEWRFMDNQYDKFEDEYADDVTAMFPNSNRGSAYWNKHSIAIRPYLKDKITVSTLKATPVNASWHIDPYSKSPYFDYYVDGVHYGEWGTFWNVTFDRFEDIHGNVSTPRLHFNKVERNFINATIAVSLDDKEIATKQVNLADFSRTKEDTRITEVKYVTFDLNIDLLEGQELKVYIKSIDSYDKQELEQGRQDYPNLYQHYINSLLQTSYIRDEVVIISK